MRDKESEWTGLSFLSGNTLLFIALDEVAAVLPFSPTTVVLGAKPWFLGLSTYRQEVFSVTDLTGFLVQKMTKVTKKSKILLIDTEEGYVGLLVDNVFSLQRCSLHHKTENKIKGLAAEYYPFIEGAIILSGTQVPVINTKAIISHPMFKDVILRTDKSIEGMK